jgi:hypothetical protein
LRLRAAGDGSFVAGALWGDAAPWWMNSESDKVFTYKDSFSDIRLELEGILHFDYFPLTQHFLIFLLRKLQ